MKKVVVIFLILPGLAAFVSGQPAGKPEPRLESNLSLGYIDYTPLANPPPGFVDTMTRHFAIVKSFWYYPFMPRLLSLGLSFDYLTDDLPLALNVALNLPAKRIVPFACAGAGFSFSGSTLQSLGGGLKFRIRKRTGLIAEYRHYWVKKKLTPMETSPRVTREANYFGAGLAYLF
jgi:hypothetical protein